MMPGDDRYIISHFWHGIISVMGKCTLSHKILVLRTVI